LIAVSDFFGRKTPHRKYPSWTAAIVPEGRLIHVIFMKTQKAIINADITVQAIRQANSSK